MSSILTLYAYPGGRPTHGSRQVPPPARMITLNARRRERELALLSSPARNDYPLVRSRTSPQAVTAPDWTLVLSALKTLLETGEPLSMPSRGRT